MRCDQNSWPGFPPHVFRTVKHAPSTTLYTPELELMQTAFLALPESTASGPSSIMPSSDKPSPQSPSPSGKNVAIVFLLYVVCIGGAMTARMFAGPYFGLAAACAAIVVWVRFGPAPFPGLLPGLMALTVFLQNVGVIVAGFVAIVRQMDR